MKLPELPPAPENVTLMEACAVLAAHFGDSTYRITALRKELAEDELKPVLNRFREEYSNAWWAYGNDVALKAIRTFSDRTSAVSWLKKKGFDEPEFSKTSFCKDDGTPMTECTLTAHGSFEDIAFTIEAS